MDARSWQRVNELFEAAIARTTASGRPLSLRRARGDEALANAAPPARARARARTRVPREAVATGALRIVALPQTAAAIDAPLIALPRRRQRSAAPIASWCGGNWAPAAWAWSTRCTTALRNEIVALKTLRRARAADLYRLKREFRSLADIAHPNLVSLYELVVEDTDCFFTMELVDGVNLVEYVREPARRRRRRLRPQSGASFVSLLMESARCTARASCIATSSRPTS